MVQASRIIQEGVKIEAVSTKGLLRYITQALEEHLTSTTTITLVEEATTLEEAFKAVFNRIRMDSLMKALGLMFIVVSLLSAIIWVDSKARGRIFKGILLITKQLNANSLKVVANVLTNHVVRLLMAIMSFACSHLMVLI